MPTELGSPLLSAFGAPAARGPRILILPALGTAARSYRRLAEAFAALGSAGSVLEWPGTGAHPVRANRASDWGYRQLLEEQVLPAIHTLSTAEAATPRPVLLLGHSLGAHLALMVRGCGRGNVCGIVTIASGSPYFRVFALPASLVLLCLIAAVGPTTRSCGYFPGHRLGFAGREPRTLMREWARFAWTGRLEVDGEEALRSTHGAPAVPVRAYSLSGDIFAPHAATAHLLACAGLPETLIERIRDPDVHGHFDWLRAPCPVAGLIQEYAIRTCGMG